MPRALDALAADVARVLDDVRAAVDRLEDDAGQGSRIDRGRSSARAAAACRRKSSPKATPSCAGSPTTISRFSATAATTSSRSTAQDALQIVPGIEPRHRCARRRAATSRRSFAALPPEVRAYARRPELLVITKSTSRSTVHRPGYLDYVAVKRFDAAGDVCGEHRFLGLFTSTAYSANPADIPLLRRKTANVGSPRRTCRRAAMPGRR